MKANSPINRCAALAAAAAVLMLLGSCTAEQAAPPRAPVAQTSPAEQPLPSRPAVVPAHWQDAPATPGDWHWGMEGNVSVASFGDGLLVLSCDQSSRAVTLLRGGAVEAAAQPIIVSTSSMTRALNGEPGSKGLSVNLPASDSLLDAMAFSRGRFAVEAGGLPVLYLPSWPEVSRVVEDCR